MAYTTTGLPEELLLSRADECSDLLGNGTQQGCVEENYVPYRDRPETYIVPIVFACILVVGVLGNGVLMITICRHANMRNVPNTYVLSLAIGDLLVILTCVPFTFMVYVLDSWPFGLMLCKVSECAKDISIGVSVFTLTALSADRFFAIVDPMRKLHATVCCSGIDPFKIHDKMFEFSKEHAEQAVEYNEEGNVHLGLQVYCNPIAFNDAYKSKKPWNCLSLLSEGVYGLEELSQRCVRKQKNTKNCKVLSPTKRLAIERKVYAFMRMKDLTINQIDDFLDNLNNYHRKVINGAKSRIEYLQKEKEKEKQVDQQVEEIAQDPAGT